MGRLAIVTVIVAALGLAACSGPPESQVTLSDPELGADPSALVGNWYQPVDDGAFYLRIILRGGSRILEAIGIAVGFEEGNMVRWLKASVHLTEIDGQTYANIRRHVGEGDDYAEPGQLPGYVIARVALSPEGGLLTTWMSASTIEGLIEEGRVQGREVAGLYDGEEVPYLLLDMDRDALVALIRSVPQDTLFDEPGVFLRLPDKDDEDEKSGRLRSAAAGPASGIRLTSRGRANRPPAVGPREPGH